MTKATNNRFLRRRFPAGIVSVLFTMLWSCGAPPPEETSTPPESPTEASIAKDSWREIPDMPVALWESGTVVIDDALYLFGGYTMGTKSSKQASVYDPANQTWRQLADLPSAITHINTVLDGRSVWIAGGFKDGYPGKAIDEVWKYDIHSDTYAAGPSLPEPRAGGGLALVGRRLHYIGGLMSDRDTDSADHWVLDLEAATEGSGEWKPAAPMPAARNQFGTVTLGRKIHAIGGQFNHDSRTDRPIAYRRLRSGNGFLDQRPRTAGAAFPCRGQHVRERRPSLHDRRDDGRPGQSKGRSLHPGALGRRRVERAWRAADVLVVAGGRHYRGPARHCRRLPRRQGSAAAHVGARRTLREIEWRHH